jgi:hypothetical protein
MKTRRGWSVLLALALVVSLASFASALTLVRDGKPVSIIVTGDEPTPAQQKAAEELQYHLQRMSGALVPIVAEKDLGDTNDTLILVGQSAKLGAMGIDTSKLEKETFIVKTTNGTLILAGEDGGSVRAPYDSSRVRTGTLFAVYDLLQDQLGVRWLWPGKSGEVIPKRATVELGDVDIQETPKMFQRHYRLGLKDRNRAESTDKFPRYMADRSSLYTEMQENESLWTKRLRQGYSLKFSYGHSFTRWYAEYHETVPEVFAMQKDGHRGLYTPTEDPALVKMCPSSDKLVDMLIEQFVAARKENPDHRFLNAIEDDGNNGFCQCDACKALDVSLTDENRAKIKDLAWSGADLDAVYGEKNDGLPYSLSNRYFHFYNKLARRLREVAPDAFVVAYAYDRYKYAPIDMKVEPNILVGLIGFNMYPVSAEDRQLQIDNFLAWKKSGVEKVFFRPNSFDFSWSHGVPWNNIGQMGGDFKILLDGGIVATDFDTYSGYTCTGAPPYYVLARMHWDTDLTEYDVYDEFCKAFGPAAGPVREYFDLWENVMLDGYTRPGVEDILKEYGPKTGRRERWRAVHRIVTDDDFARAAEILQRARTAADASGDPDLQERIHIFELGLRHGVLTCKASAFNNDVAKSDKDTYYEEQWPVVKEIFDIREELGKLQSDDIFWLFSYEVEYGDLYGTRVAQDFYKRPYVPVMTPAHDSWTFAPDAEDQGEAQGWSAVELLEPVAVKKPLAANFFYSGWNGTQQIKQWQVDTKRKNVVNGWYQVKFDVPAEKLPADAVILVPYIQGSAKIWVNGKLVRETTAEQGIADEAITISMDEAGVIAGEPFWLTIKVTKPSDQGGLIGPAYIAKPAA